MVSVDFKRTCESESVRVDPDDSMHVCFESDFYSSYGQFSENFTLAKSRVVAFPGTFQARVSMGASPCA